MKTRTSIVILLLIAVIGYAAYAAINNTWPFTREENLSGQEEISTPDINAPQSSDDLSIKESGNNTQGNSSTAGTGISDTGGDTVEPTDNGISSESGAITLYTPTMNQKLNDNARVTGAAEIQQVQYRLKDTVHGVIGQGELTVNKGLFSGNLQINTDATSGSLELYSFDDQGREINNIEIEVKY